MSYNEQIGLEQIVLARYVKNNDTMDAISKEFNKLAIAIACG